MKIIKLILKLILLLLLLVCIIFINTYKPETTIMLNIQSSVNEKSQFIKDISEKHKLLYISKDNNLSEKANEIKTFIETTDMKNYIDFIPIDNSNPENTIFINSLTNNNSTKEDTFLLVNRITNIDNVFEEELDSAEIISYLKQYFEKYL